MKKTKQQNNLIIERKNRKSYEELMTDETIFALANGVLGTRGHFIEGYGMYDYPQTLVNGFYNTYPYKYEENYKQFPQVGQTIVNLPDASYIKIESDDEVIDLSHAEFIELDRNLDMNQGTTFRKATYLTKHGYEFQIVEEKIVPHDINMVVSRLKVKSNNYQGKIRLTSYLRMPLEKKAHPLDPRLPYATKDLDIEQIHADHDFAYLTARTTNTSLSARVCMTHDQPLDYKVEDDEVHASMIYDLKPNIDISLTKYQLYYTDLETDDFDQAMDEDLKNLRKFEDYVETETIIRKDFWSKSDIQVDDTKIEQALHFNIYQLNLSGGVQPSTSIAAKGITGEGYEGHYFWDTEIYLLPFFILTQPQKAKNLLMYRYQTLDHARLEAKNLGGTRGAKIPWRTINGKEASPYYPAGSAQIHINSDIAFAIKSYFEATKDLEFMIDYGAEILLETAIFLLDYGHFHNQTFHLNSVTGPDEYSAIVDNNYYTNRMAKAHFEYTYDFITEHKDSLNALLERIDITNNDLELMKKAAEQMTLLVNQESNVIKQDASFMSKKELDIEGIPKQNFPLLLNYHPLYIYKHQVLKQADTMIALVLLDEHDKTLYQNTFEYYLKRTTHDSSLSKCIYGIAAYHLGHHELGYKYFKAVTEFDLMDVKKFTRYGLHVANLGGSYLMLIYGLFGIRMNKILLINPAYQTEIKKAKTTILYQGVSIHLSLNQQKINIKTNAPLTVMIYGQKVIIDQEHEFEMISF
jgi:alpha,alpha-trehalose phosphorylase